MPSDSTDFVTSLNRDNESVKRILEVMVEESRLSLVSASEVGRIIAPRDEGAQLLIVSYGYGRLAHADRDNYKGLWRYAAALLAADKAGSPDIKAEQLRSLREDYPELDKNTLDFLGRLGR